MCRLARTPHCERFKGAGECPKGRGPSPGDYGYDRLARQTDFGLRLQMRVGPSGLIHCVYLTPAQEDEKALEV
ncbi:MAG: hypothetical protein KY468_02930 [Armatimonadetes bacterium]|nr:hypothetical protein [Armatimonadota bacterium]